MKMILTAAALGLAGLSTVAGAQTVDQRHAIEQHRIIRGEENGSLTRHEASRLETQQLSIREQERHMRERHGGRLTWRDRMILRQREARARRAIWRAKHNGAYRRY